MVKIVFSVALKAVISLFMYEQHVLLIMMIFDFEKTAKDALAAESLNYIDLTFTFKEAL